MGLISRVPHASESLTGKIDRDTVFAGWRSSLASQPRQHARQLRQGRDPRPSCGRGRAGRWRQAAIAGILANPAFTTVLPTCVSREEVLEYAAASDQPLDADEQSRLDALVGPELRSREPVRDAAEVECVRRLW